MSPLLGWLSAHKFQVMVFAFCLLAFPPVVLYFTAQSAVWVIAMLTLVVLGNLLAVLTP